MAKDKQQKKKEREKRVAQKKLAEAEKRAQQKATKDAAQPVPRTKKVMTAAAAPKPTYTPPNTKSPFTHRRTGSG
jgi:hypothetical protein